MIRTVPFLCLLVLGALTCSACSSTIDVGDDEGGGGTPGPGPTGSKRMFVTRAAYTGDLAVLGEGQAAPGSDRGADGADRLCAAAAQAANLGGSWKAWISSCTMGPESTCVDVHNAIDRIADVPGGWYNVNRSAHLFSNKGNLASYPLANAWTDGAAEPKSNVLDEHGNALPTNEKDSTQVWTGTGNGGLLAQGTCSGWTAPETGDTKGTIGLMTPDPSKWTNVTIEECHHPSHLYCLEQ